MPALREATDQLEKFARKFRAFHFRNILTGMIVSCLVIMGGYWWILPNHYDRKVIEPKMLSKVRPFLDAKIRWRTLPTALGVE